ncbi:hypothetical protein P8605_15335, partial [Streptomyces sp. T-3]|nr:hypothetical protein [Streptomyces sp. T-3]
MTEHPTSHEGRQASTDRPTAPADPRGSLLRSPENPKILNKKDRPGSSPRPREASAALPAQGLPDD